MGDGTKCSLRGGSGYLYLRRKGKEVNKQNRLRDKVCPYSLGGRFEQ